MRTVKLFGLFLPAAGCLFDKGRLDDKLDELASDAATITGTVEVYGLQEAADAWVFVFDTRDPPTGGGVPIASVAVPESAFDTASGEGALTAAYEVSGLRPAVPGEGLFPEGYLVAAVVDADADLVLPDRYGLGGMTCGDLYGYHFSDLIDRNAAPVFVEPKEVRDRVTVVVDWREQAERPAFTFFDLPDLPIISLEKGSLSALSRDPTAQHVQQFFLESVPVATTYETRGADSADLELDGPCPLDTRPSSLGNEQDPSTCHYSGACRCDLESLAASPCQTTFQLFFVDDCDNEAVAPGNEEETCGSPDGKLDPYPADHQALDRIFNVYPRVRTELYAGPDGAPLELGEFTDQSNPDRVLPERWVGEAFPVALQMNFAGGNPAYLAFGMHELLHVDADQDGDLDPESVLNVPIPVNRLAVTWWPVVRHYHQAGAYDYDPAHGQYDLIDLRCNKSDGALPPDIPYCADAIAALDSQRAVALGEITLGDVPEGRWLVTVLTGSGQSWTVANEIGSEELAREAGLVAPMLSNDLQHFNAGSQNVWLTMVERQ